MLKIIFPITMYYPVEGGASYYAQELASGLVERGYKICVYTIGKKKEEFVHKGVLIKRFPAKEIYRTYKFSLSFIKELLKENADIIHSHHYGYFPATAGFIAAKLKNVPHALTPHYHPPIYGRKRWFFFCLYHITQGLPLLRFSDKILPHTTIEKVNLCKIGAKCENTEILPSIINIDRFKPTKTESDEKNTVLYVSYLYYTKGYKIVLNIAKEILKERNDTKFVFIGHGSQNVEKTFKKEITKFKGKIIWKKDIPLNELIKWYSVADVLVLPSMYEAFGRVLAEAQACETPVVSTRVGGIPEVVKDSKTGFLVDYGDWKKMKEKIEFLLDNPKIARKMGKAGRKWVVKNFSKEVVINKLDRIYKSLV